MLDAEDQMRSQSWKLESLCCTSGPFRGLDSQDSPLVWKPPSSRLLHCESMAAFTPTSSSIVQDEPRDFALRGHEPKGRNSLSM